MPSQDSSSGDIFPSKETVEEVEDVNHVYIGARTNLTRQRLLFLASLFAIILVLLGQSLV